jgi:hypothetical protein
MVKAVGTVWACAAVALGLSGVHSSQTAAVGLPPTTVLPTSLVSGSPCGPVGQATTRIVFSVPGGSGTFTASTLLPNGGFAPIPATATIEQDLTARTFRVAGATFGSRMAYVLDVIGDNGSQFPRWQTPPSFGGGTQLLDVSALGNFTSFSLCLRPADKTLTLTSSVDSGSGVFGYHFDCTQMFGGDPFTSFDFDVPTSATTPGVVTLDVPTSVECGVHTSSVPAGYVSDSDKMLGRFAEVYPHTGMNTSQEMRNKRGTFDLDVQTTVHKVVIGAEVHYDFEVTVKNLGSVDFVAAGAVDSFDDFVVKITHPTPLVNSYPVVFPGMQRVGTTTLYASGRGHQWLIPSIAAGQSYTFTTGAEAYDQSYVPLGTDVCADVPTNGFLLQPVELNTANNRSCVSIMP